MDIGALIPKLFTEFYSSLKSLNFRAVGKITITFELL